MNYLRKYKKYKNAGLPIMDFDGKSMHYLNFYKMKNNKGKEKINEKEGRKKRKTLLTRLKPRASSFPAFSQKLAVNWEWRAADLLPGNRLPLTLLSQEPLCSDVRGT